MVSRDRFAGKAAHHLQSSGCEGKVLATDVLHALVGGTKELSQILRDIITWKSLEIITQLHSENLLGPIRK